VQLRNAEGLAVTAEIPLNAPIDLRMGVAAARFREVPADAALQGGLPEHYAGILVVARQSATLVLGRDMSDGVYNTTTAVWGPETYMTHPEDVYWTYPEDVYETQEIPDGKSVLKYQIVNGEIVLNKL